MRDEDVAKKLNVHFTTVSHLRTGNNLPSFSLMWRIHQVMDLPAAELLEKAAEGNEAFSDYFNEQLTAYKEKQARRN